MNDKVTMTFRDVEDSYPESPRLPAFVPLTPEERELRRARFAAIEVVLQRLDPSFDGAPFTYSELLTEAVRRLEGERARIGADAQPEKKGSQQ